MARVRQQGSISTACCRYSVGNSILMFCSSESSVQHLKAEELQSVTVAGEQATCVMCSLALVRDILRPAPCEQELQEDALPRPLVTKLPAPAYVTWTSALCDTSIRYYSHRGSSPHWTLGEGHTCI